MNPDIGTEMAGTVILRQGLNWPRILHHTVCIRYDRWMRYWASSVNAHMVQQGSINVMARGALLRYLYRFFTGRFRTTLDRAASE